MMDKKKTVVEDPGLEYAPIIIPTLCRRRHLEECIDSLSKSPLAQYTKLYISVDYPPAEKYRKGFEEVKAYIREGISGFQEVIYFIQDSNLGPLGNERFLINEVYKNYDRYIFTEDDNVFAPSAIDYWNKGLQMFEEDPDIIAVCAKAFAEYNREDEDPVFRLQSFSGYGFATWKRKETEYRSKITKELCLKIIKDRKKFYKVYIGNKGPLFGLLSIVLEKETVHFDRDGNLGCTDYAITLYMIYYNKYAVYPRRFLTKNNGYDGSGVNCKAQISDDRVLDMRTEFDMQMTGHLQEEKVLKRDKGLGNIRRILMLIEAVLVKYFGTDYYRYVKRVIGKRKGVIR